MTATAWRAYAAHALGARALRPLSRSPSDEVSHYSTGLTVLEAMSTLKVMNLEEEYRQARQYVLKQLKVPKAGVSGAGGGESQQPLYVWPLVTRYIGSFLSCFALTGDQQLLKKAVDFGEAVRPAFGSKDRPFNRIDINFSDSTSANQMGFIGEMGAMTLELRYLAALTNSSKQTKPDWNSIITRLRQLSTSSPSEGLYRLTQELLFHTQYRRFSLANDANHFFGYLVRSSIQTAGRDVQAMAMFTQALDAAERHRVLVRNATSGLVTVEDVDYISRQGEGVMKVGACQLPSTLALAGKICLAEALLESCLMLNLESTINGSTGNDSSNSTAEALAAPPHRLPTAEVLLRGQIGRDVDSRGVLSPELAESYFTLWRLTRKQKWRARAWDLVRTINATARLADRSGFSELTNSESSGSKTNYQPAEFLGGTLKFLYLTFADFNQLPLDRWVFNAVGQPLPVCGTGPAYPKC